MDHQAALPIGNKERNVFLMKKILVLLLAVLMALSCIAHAESILDADPEEIMTFDRTSYVVDWQGEWVLAAAYIGEDFADENDIKVTGLIAVPENALKMTVLATLDLSATGSPEGVMVDMANYWHAHVYDMEATLKFDESITDDEPYLRIPWDGWLYENRGDQDGDYNFGVGKLNKVQAKEKNLYFCEITGVESDAIADENMKYVGMNTAGNLIVCYSDDNMVKKNGDVAFAYIFVRAE